MSLMAVLFLSFAVMIILEVPIAIALALSSLLTAYLAGIEPIIVVQNMFSGIDNYTLLAIGLFILAGDVMEAGTITDRLVAFARTIVGHIRGGLGQVTIFASMIISGVSGSGAADAAAIGGLMIPAMKKEGYPPEMAVAINASATTMGPIIPPSILMILFGAYGGVSVAALFVGGVIPGALIGGFMMLVLYRWAKKRDFPVSPRATWGERLERAGESIWALLAPFIILYGIIGGYFTPTESAMFAAVYCLLVGLFVYRIISLKDLLKVFASAARASAQPLFTVAAASTFAFMMAFLQIPDMVLDLATGVTGQPIPTLLFFTAIFLVMGTFMDSTPALIIFMPIVMKLTAAAGLNAVHVGVLVCLVLSFGFLTPPYGITLMISSGIGQVPMMNVIRSLIPFYVVMLIIIALIIFFPEIVLVLPRFFVPSSV